MELHRLFRYLVFGNIGLFALWFSVPYLSAPFLSTDSLDALTWSEAGALLRIPKTVTWMSWGLYVISLLGVANFVRDARWLLVGMTVYFYFVGIFAGMVVSTSVDNFVAHASSLADGAIIALSFSPGLRERFKPAE